YLALAYAARHPSTVRALVLLDAGGNDVRSWLPITPSMLAKLEPRQRRKARLACASMRPSEACDRAELPTLFYAPARIPQFVAPMAKDKVFDHVDVNDPVTFDIVLEPHLTILNGPCPPSLIVFGAADPYGDPGVQEVGHLVPCAKEAIISRAGHFTWFERPDGFTQIVRPFMAANDSPGSASSAAK
nr:alpha/beta hydrolase [Candidatus Eremiobacteraeota bacterium]